MYSGTPQPSIDNQVIPYSHSIYCATHPVDGFIRVGVAHVASAEIRHYVMAGCQIVQLLFMNRTPANDLQSAVLRSVASPLRNIDPSHPILGESGLNGGGTAWSAQGGVHDLAAMAKNLRISHMNGLLDLPYEVLRTTLGLPRLRWKDWRTGPVSADYREPSFPARHVSRRDDLATRS